MEIAGINLASKPKEKYNTIDYKDRELSVIIKKIWQSKKFLCMKAFQHQQLTKPLINLEQLIRLWN